MSTLSLATPDDFHLDKAVASYGYFLLAPNHWDPDRRVLTRPFRLGRSLVTTRTTQPRPGRLTLRTDEPVDRKQAGHLKAALARMLRIDDDLTEWRRLCPPAAKRHFGRLFRSPTLFEDMVKTITGCNVTWTQTIAMNRLLVEHVGRGDFPSPRQLSRWDPDKLNQVTKVGYRAERILRLARSFLDGRIDPAWYEAPDRTTDELYDALRSIYGFGDYAASNLLMLLGRYDRIAIDTETYRHFTKTRGLDRPTPASQLDPVIRDHYARFAPYPFLAYWFELWEGYEAIVGRRAEAWRHEDGQTFTVRNLKQA
jgi:3-methyladenine DNA glycosylase/8-oxoguanine DNA glycosylase